jgi:flagellar biosynthesis protein
MSDINDSGPKVRRVPAVDQAGRQPPFEPPVASKDPAGEAPRAVALEYRRGDQRAPVVTAFGKGKLAEQIIAVARAHGVYIESDPDLVELLAQVDVGMAIPPHLYYVVAEILAFVYKLNGAQAAPSPTETNRT